MAILGAVAFDVTDVVVSSLVLGSSQAPVHEGHFGDLNGDGNIDLMVHFRTQELGIDPATADGTTVTLLLSGELQDGTQISGSTQARLTPSAFAPKPLVAPKAAKLGPNAPGPEIQEPDLPEGDGTEGGDAADDDDDDGENDGDSR